MSVSFCMCASFARQLVSVWDRRWNSVGLLFEMVTLNVCCQFLSDQIFFKMLPMKFRNAVKMHFDFFPAVYWVATRGGFFEWGYVMKRATFMFLCFWMKLFSKTRQAIRVLVWHASLTPLKCTRCLGLTFSAIRPKVIIRKEWTHPLHCPFFCLYSSQSHDALVESLMHQMWNNYR